MHYLPSSLMSTIHASISHTMLTILHNSVFSAYVTLYSFPHWNHYCPLYSSVAAMMVNGQADGDLRLTGFESSRLAGRVEMNLFGYWYTICNDFFTLREAAVVCRQLGLGYPVRIFNQDTDGPDKMPWTTSDSPVSRLVIDWCGFVHVTKMSCDKLSLKKVWFWKWHFFHGQRHSCHGWCELQWGRTSHS